MATKPGRPCAHPGCPNITTNTPRYCDKHLKQYQREVDGRRGSANERGYTKSWRRARTYYLQQYPLCVMCQRAGRVTMATVVDHIRPHRGDYNLFWDEGNWQSLCKSCHDRKTATTDGAFGHRG